VEERNRLSREMHDTLGHHLTSTAVQLEAAQRLLPEQSERAATILGEVRLEVRQALTELRQTVSRLREPVEAELDLPQALRRMIERFQAANGLQVQLELPGETCTMTAAQRLALFRAAQEGLTNIQRHAQATSACLRLVCSSDEIRLELLDNGLGLPVEGVTSLSGFGLRGLAERAAALGGEAHLENAPGGGAVLSLRLPRGDE
jgi:signal transduction histidine kinase